MNNVQLPDSSTATLVVAYRINLDNSTGNFVGYGSLVMIDRPLAILHTGAADRLLADKPKHQLTLRLQVVDGAGAAEVTDAVVLVNANSGGPLAADPYGTGTTTAPQWEFNAATWENLLAEDERGDPSTPPLPPPDPSDNFSLLGAQPPWCLIWPNCPGC